jgi:cell division inhibitor SulA
LKTAQNNILLIYTVLIYTVFLKVVFMLSRYQQQPNNNSFNVNIVDSHVSNTQNRLTVSYDLNNYQSLLEHLQTSDDPRWILFIAPPGKPNFHFLKQAGINKSRIITLAQKQLDNPEQLFKDALVSNNYAVVIHWMGLCDKPLINEINQLTTDSNTHCFVYCSQ